MNHKRLAATGLGALILIWAIHYTTNHVQQFGTIKGHTVPATQDASAVVRSLHPIYPYSIIPGGAYSPGELKWAHSQDQVVRAHYSDFNVAHAKLVVLTDDRFQYASYRVKNQVFWTKKRLRIPKGELLLTDGENFARARCGNRLSEHPHAEATSPHEPAEAALTMPAINRETLSNVAFANAPVLGGVSTGTPILPAESGAEAFSGGEVTQPSAKVIAPLDAVEPVQPFVGGVVGGSVVGGTPLLPNSPGGGGTPPTPSTPGNGGGPPVTPVPPAGPPPETTPVPEPHSVYLFLVGLVLSLAGLRWLKPKEAIKPDA